MSFLNSILILVVAFLVVFAQSTFAPFRNLVGVQPDLLPSLLVYVGLTASLLELSLLAIASGLWLDSLSANPLGVSILPLFLVGFTLRNYRGLILREHLHAQWILGGCATAAAPLLTLVLIWATGKTPLLGWFSLWQWFVLTLIGATCTPLWFGLFDRLSGALNYRRIEETSFRTDREIKRGRYY